MSIGKLRNCLNNLWENDEVKFNRMRIANIRLTKMHKKSYQRLLRFLIRDTLNADECKETILRNMHQNRMRSLLYKRYFS